MPSSPIKPDFYPGWEDAAVAPEHLGDYLREFQQKMQEYGYSASVYGHFGQGCIHCRINFDLFTKDGIAQYRKFVHEMAHIVVKYKGSISGEHGDGQIRGELLPIMFGDELVQAFWQFKTAFDPDNKMNPGKVVRPYPIDENLRWGVNYQPWDPPTKFAFQEDHHSFAYAANRCVGAGVCRKHDKGTMCPSYMVSKEEKYSTRGRARLLFEMLQGNPMKHGWKDETVKESLEYCLACKGCKHECPVNVDMATYKAEFLFHYFKGKVRPLHMWLFGYMFWWAKIAALMPNVANFFTQAPPFSTVMKKLGSIAPEREIPMFADYTFRQWYAKRPRRGGNGSAKTGVDNRVILWTDTWNEHFHPQTARAAVEVLEDAGYEVLIPPNQICCGRPLYDYGLLDQAKRQLKAILDDLRPLVREGVPVVGLEPSCLSVFKDEMQNMLGNDMDAQRLAKQSFMFETFLNKKAEEEEHYKPPKLHRHAVVHEHCHKKSLLDPTAETHVFEQMELDYEKLNSGCCGMAGAFGFEESHYDMSVKCGERVLLPKVREAKPQTIVVADGFSCREQIMQTTQRQALHPAEVMKMAMDDRGFERDDAYPELRFMPDHRKKRDRIVARGYARFGNADCSGRPCRSVHRAPARRTMKNLLAALGVRVDRAQARQETGLRLKDKVAIVTGGDTGIGKAICIAMAREGAGVVIDYHGDEQPATALVREIEGFGANACAVGADVSQAQDVQTLVDAAVTRFGKLDIMVNNAGMEQKFAFLEMPLEVYSKIISVNLTGAWLGSQIAGRRMAQQKHGGRIINISSIHEDVAMPTNAAYCVSKGGMRMLTRTIAVELAQHGITVNNVCPGAIDTPMDANLKKAQEKYDELLSEIPMRRMGKPEEIAAMCVYLASDDAAYVTGASLVVDGGMSKQSGSL